MKVVRSENGNESQEVIYLQGFAGSSVVSSRKYLLNFLCTKVLQRVRLPTLRFLRCLHRFKQSYVFRTMKRTPAPTYLLNFLCTKGLQRVRLPTLRFLRCLHRSKQSYVFRTLKRTPAPTLFPEVVEKRNNLDKLCERWWKVGKLIFILLSQIKKQTIVELFCYAFPPPFELLTLYPFESDVIFI